MNTTRGVLFGIDRSDFARQALTRVADLVKGCPQLRFTLFHGAQEPDFSMLSEADRPDRDGIQKHRRQWEAHAHNLLEAARQTLTESGFDAGALSTVFDPNCIDPSAALVRLAGQKGIDTVAVARWGRATVSRQVIGSATYRLSQLADDLALWVVDPRICSHNVLLGLVGAPVSQRVVDHTLRYFGHLKDSTFTLMHVTPPIPPQYWESEDMAMLEASQKRDQMVLWMKEYADKVEAVAREARKKLIDAGIPASKVVFKLVPQKRGIARDICQELEEGDHGILVVGRRGYKDIREFRLGSKAHKMLLSGRTFITCLVN